MQASYYFPNLRNEEDMSRRSEFWQKKDESSSSIRFRADMSKSPYLFLCDTWPDVNNPGLTYLKWMISPDKKPLFRIQGEGGFRTLRHYLSYKFFEEIDGEFASLFTWGRRHEASMIYKKATMVRKNKKIAKERKKTNPNESKIQKIESEWKETAYHGLAGDHAITLSTWFCCNHSINCTENEYKRRKNIFMVDNAIQVYARGIYEILRQNPSIYKALKSTRGDLIAVGGTLKEMWHYISGHNLLGELWMHYRRDGLGVLRRYQMRKYNYGTSSSSSLLSLASNQEDWKNQVNHLVRKLNELASVRSIERQPHPRIGDTLGDLNWEDISVISGQLCTLCGDNTTTSPGQLSRSVARRKHELFFKMLEALNIVVFGKMSSSPISAQKVLKLAKSTYYIANSALTYSNGLE